MANTIDAPQTTLDKTVRIFDKFYQVDEVVNANEYEIVYSYFYSLSKSEDIAKNFSAMIFRISNITGKYSLDLLDQVKGKTKMETNALMAYYLNSLKSKSSLYGVSVVPQPNQTVQRNVVI